MRFENTDLPVVFYAFVIIFDAAASRFLMKNFDDISFLIVFVYSCHQIVIIFFYTGSRNK